MIIFDACDVYFRRFGFVCKGYRYRLTLKVHNKSNVPQRMRVLCSKATFPPTATPLDAAAIKAMNGIASIPCLLLVLPKWLNHY